ncbi:unnamed protein product, partial [Aphanomyces euteiches]
DDMCRVVLELRYSTHRDAFNASLSAKQLSLLWEKLALRFNIVTEQPQKVVKPFYIGKY